MPGVGAKDGGGNGNGGANKISKKLSKLREMKGGLQGDQ
jgi:hypothetical protein